MSELPCKGSYDKFGSRWGVVMPSSDVNAEETLYECRKGVVKPILLILNRLLSQVLKLD